MNSPGPRIYRFGPFALEPAERRLLADGKPVILAPKVFDTLVLLVERAGRVTTKDELMRALWPRGYVDESTLSNHIWQIRRALGDTAKAAGFIETVPKLGYRFTAAVTLAPAVTSAAAGAPNPASPPPPAARQRRQLPRSRWSLWIIAAAGALVAVFAWNVRHRDLAPSAATPAPAATRPAATRPAVPALAVVAFDSLSKVATDAWLARALVATLATELEPSADLWLPPFADVREASRDLPAPVAGGYPREALASLQRRTAARYVLSGHYLLGASGPDPTLRIDIALQDSASGALLVVTSVESHLSALNGLVAQVADVVRAKLGIAQPDPATRALVAAAQPPTPETARHVALAWDGMDHHDFARARDEWLEVVAQAPGYAAGSLQLAKAWWALGFRQEALAAAEQAGRGADSLPPTARLQIAALAASAAYDAPGTAAAWQSLVALRPHALEYRIAWLDAAREADDATGAERIATALRSLPEASGDPRVAMASARASAGDPQASAKFAAEAERLARERESPALSADAVLGMAHAWARLGRFDETTKALAAAISAYHALGDARGEAAARRLLANTLGRLHRSADARAEYQRAMALSQQIGDAGVVGAIYRDLCELLWEAGSRDAAQLAARRALEIGRQTGDLQLQAWTLRALATVAADEALSDAVMNDYAEVTALTERTHDAGAHVWSLTAAADALRVRGELAESKSNCDRARPEAAKLSDPQFRVFTDFTCALLALDRGAAIEARATLGQVLSLAQSADIPLYGANAQLVLGQIEYEEGNYAAARTSLHRAIEGFAAQEVPTGEANAEALLALCAAAEGDASERTRAERRAAKLRAGITSRGEVYFVDIALAQLAATEQRAVAVARLRSIAADAERRQFTAWKLEAQLAEWRLLRAGADNNAADRVGEELSKAAAAAGFGRIAVLMDRARR